jgi:hypothetical protein
VITVSSLALPHQPSTQPYLLAEVDEWGEFVNGALPLIHNVGRSRVEDP